MNNLKRKTHVVQLIGSTGLYGAERWILALMRAINIDRFHLTLINLVDTEDEESEVVAEARKKGLNALDLYTGGTLNPFSVIRLARWSRKHNVQIIQGHGFKSDAVGLFAARLAGCKAMTTPHGWSLEADRKLQLYENLDRVLFRFMDMVCPLSPELETGIRGRIKSTSLRLITNGVDIDEVQAAVPAERDISGAYVIGYIGQLIERKDLNTLLFAVKQLCDEQVFIKLIIIGDGLKKTALQEESVRLGITEQVTFLGFRSDAVALLKTLDLFILPSLMEGIPRCIMEAMAATVPVVVSNIPGNRALVSHGETGLLFTPGDSQDLAQKINYLINHPVEASAIALRGTQKVVEEYSNRRMASEYSHLYCELLEDH